MDNALWYLFCHDHMNDSVDFSTLEFDDQGHYVFVRLYFCVFSSSTFVMEASYHWCLGQGHKGFLP